MIEGVRPRLAGNSGALDQQREERSRYGHQPRESGVVHPEPRHSQRGVLPARRSRLHARPRLHRHGWAVVLFRRKARHPFGDVTGRAWRACLSDSQYGARRPLPNREGSADRSMAGRRASANTVRAPRWNTGRLSSVRPPGTTPRQPSKRQHGLGRGLQGDSGAVCRTRPSRTRTRIDGALGRAFGRIRGLLGRLATAAGRQAARPHIPPRRERKCRGHR